MKKFNWLICSLFALICGFKLLHGFTMPRLSPQLCLSAQIQFFRTSRVDKEPATRHQLQKEDYNGEEQVLSSSSEKEKWKSLLILNAVAVIFGSQHAVIKASF